MIGFYKYPCWVYGKTQGPSTRFHAGFMANTVSTYPVPCWVYGETQDPRTWFSCRVYGETQGPHTCFPCCGWYGVVRVFCTPKSLQTSFKTSASNCLPWSECNCSGGEKRRKNSFTSTLAMVLASWLGMGYASIQRVK